MLLRLGEGRRRAFGSLAVPNYRRYFAAMLVSSSGTWLQLVAESWLVLRLGGSGFALGITTALAFLPLLLFGTYGGVLVDRWEKRALVTGTQTAAGLLALAVGVATVTHVVQIWMVWLAALLLGFVNVVDSPGRQAFAYELVGPELVANAVSLNNAAITSARAIGPAIGGALIATVGIAACFLINAASYAAVVLALLSMNARKLHREATQPRRGRQVREGIRYVASHRQLRTVLLVLAVASTFGLNFQVLIPLFATGTFHGGSLLYGLMMSSLGVGMVIGSLLSAGWSKPTVGRVIALVELFAVALLAVTVAPDLHLAVLAIAAMGASTSLYLTSSVGCLQLHSRKGMRGRVMAMYSIAFLGVAPIGGPVVGGVAQLLQARAGFLVGALASGLAGIVAAAWLLSQHRLVRRGTPVS